VIDYEDIINGINKLVQAGIVDPQYIGVWGWSYGGFMSSWMTTQTNRFKAVVTAAGISDWISLVGTSVDDTAKYFFGSEFWESQQLWLDRSPIFRIQFIKTPILIQSGDEDHEVPISQSFELYHALKATNKPVKMLIYPSKVHGLRGDPEILLKATEDMQNWFDYYMKK